MNTSFYLKVNKWGSVRAVTQAKSLAGDEVLISLELEIPDRIFEKPSLQATITIPEEAVGNTPINAEVKDNVAEAIEQATGLKFAITVVEKKEEVANV